MKHSLYQAVNWLWEQHFPRLCLLCGQVITSASPDHLCPYSRLALPFNVRAWSRCAIPLSPHATLTGNAIGYPEPATCCGQCMTKPMADSAVAPLIHRDGAAHLIHRLKFHQGEPEDRALAHILLTHIRYKYPQCLPEILVLVPMAYWPAVKRGFNQSRLLAHYLGREFNLPVKHALLKRRAGPAQRTLVRSERERMALGNFYWCGEEGVSTLRGKHVAVVDDVVTTGPLRGRSSSYYVRMARIELMSGVQHARPLMAYDQATQSFSARQPFSTPLTDTVRQCKPNKTT